MRGGTLFPVAAALVGLRLAASLVLSAINRAEVRRRSAAPPRAVAALFDQPTRARAAAYTLAKSRLGDASEVWDAVVLLILLASGLLPQLFRAISGWAAPSAPTAPAAAWTGAAFLFAAFGALALLALPWEAAEQFGLEARFGFNRSTKGLWLLDRLKGFVLALLLGFPLTWALLALVRRVGAGWWLWAAALVFAVQVGMLLLYPRLILPLFNRLSPLPEGELRARLLALGERSGFRAGAIDVIDGSKRSAHSNAYFTGFGRFRRVILFDTLVQQLSPEELEAVLAHEIGHYQLGHLPKRIALSAVSLLAGFAILAWFARTPGFTQGFGFPSAADAPAFLLAGLLAGTVTFWLTPVLAAWSRRHEYEADAFARQAVGTAAPMIGALRKLSEKNLSNLTPHPWYSAFHYSHPTLIEREAALAGGPASTSRART